MCSTSRPRGRTQRHLDRQPMRSGGLWVVDDMGDLHERSADRCLGVVASAGGLSRVSRPEQTSVASGLAWGTTSGSTTAKGMGPLRPRSLVSSWGSTSDGRALVAREEGYGRSASRTWGQWSLKIRQPGRSTWSLCSSSCEPCHGRVPMPIRSSNPSSGLKRSIASSLWSQSLPFSRKCPWPRTRLWTIRLYRSSLIGVTRDSRSECETCLPARKCFCALAVTLGVVSLAPGHAELARTLRCSAPKILREQDRYAFLEEHESSAAWRAAK